MILASDSRSEASRSREFIEKGLRWEEDVHSTKTYSKHGRNPTLKSISSDAGHSQITRGDVTSPQKVSLEPAESVITPCVPSSSGKLKRKRRVSTSSTGSASGTFHRNDVVPDDESDYQSAKSELGDTGEDMIISQQACNRLSGKMDVTRAHPPFMVSVPFPPDYSFQIGSHKDQGVHSAFSHSTKQLLGLCSSLAVNTDVTMAFETSKKVSVFHQERALIERRPRPQRPQPTKQTPAPTPTSRNSKKRKAKSTKPPPPPAKECPKPPKKKQKKQQGAPDLPKKFRTLVDVLRELRRENVDEIESHVLSERLLQQNKNVFCYLKKGKAKTSMITRHTSQACGKGIVKLSGKGGVIVKLSSDYY